MVQKLLKKMHPVGRKTPLSSATWINVFFGLSPINQQAIADFLETLHCVNFCMSCTHKYVYQPLPPPPPSCLTSAGHRADEPVRVAGEPVDFPTPHHPAAGHRHLLHRLVLRL